MKLAHLLALAAVATASAAAAANTQRFVLDDGRASAIFPDGAPVKMTMTPQHLPGADLAADRGALANLPPSENWMDHGNGQTYSVMVIRKADARYPVSQRCSPTRTTGAGEHALTHTCRLVSQNGVTVPENRTSRDDGTLTVMRTFERGERRYTVSFMRMSDRLRRQTATVMRGPPGDIADGEAFLDSFRLESRASH